MNTPQVIHHTDYRSKAEDRRRELEKLQEKGLAKTQAAQLRDAPVPTEACNFLKKQRELFETRRKNQADAIEFLHQFRADDDFVLRSARHSLGSKTGDLSVTPNSTRKFELEPGQQPDARAALYSYELHDTLTQTMNSRTATHDNISNDSSSLQSPVNPPEIISNSIPFEYAFEVLELAAKEASKHPLPEDSEVENASGDDEDNSEREAGALNDFVAFSDQRTMHCKSASNYGDLRADGEINGQADGAAQLSLLDANCIDDCGEKDECDTTTSKIEHENCSPILIVEGDIDDDIISSPKKDSSVVADSAVNSAMTPFIPFEAFSKLGESLVLESRRADVSTHHDGLPLHQCDSDESSIPGHSFMQLGASMMANDLSCTSRDEDKGPIVPGKESKESAMGNSDSISNTATEITASQVTMGSKSMATEDGIAEGANDETSKAPLTVCCDDTPNQNLCERIIDTEAIMDGAVFEDIETPKKSNRNITKCNMEGTTCAGQTGNEVEEESKTNTESSIPESVGAEPHTSRRRKGSRKKKKNKDKTYYPSSSLFVSRQFLSR